MPIQNLGGGCYRWGDSGRKYCGKDAKKKARQQGVAINLSLKRAGKPSEFDKANDFTAEEIAQAELELELSQHLDELNE